MKRWLILFSMLALLPGAISFAETNIYVGGSADGYDDDYSWPAAGYPYADNAAGATGITDLSAWLNGFLVSTGSAETTVHVYWGDENGVTNKTGWAHWTNFGVRTIWQALTTNVTLSAGTTYYYRFYASNTAGEEAWAISSSSFETDPAAVVDNASGATNVLNTSAFLNGTLTSTGSAPTTVHVYWGTEDGTNNRASWGHTNDFGVQDQLGILTTNVTELNENTLYYYRFYATNVNGEVWAISSESFTTYVSPAVNNGWGAGPVSFTTATLSGNLTSGTLANVYIYWGQDTNSWANTNDFGNRANGLFWSSISGLSDGLEYYYRCYATNDYGEGWADTVTFTTLVSFTVWSGGDADGYDADSDLATATPGIHGTVFVIH